MSPALAMTTTCRLASRSSAASAAITPRSKRLCSSNGRSRGRWAGDRCHCEALDAEAIQNIPHLGLDCFVAELVIGPATSGRTRWLLAMTSAAISRADEAIVDQIVERFFHLNI